MSQHAVKPMITTAAIECVAERTGYYRFIAERPFLLIFRTPDGESSFTVGSESFGTAVVFEMTDYNSLPITGVTSGYVSYARSDGILMCENQNTRDPDYIGVDVWMDAGDHAFVVGIDGFVLVSLAFGFLSKHRISVYHWPTNPGLME